MMECCQEEVEKKEMIKQQQQHTSKSQQGGFFVKVMTDEQMEVLREQISLYATISHRLVDMHNKAFSQHQNHLTGMKLGMERLYCESLMRGGHKNTARQRWNPTPNQLKILERIFDEGNGNPSKQETKEITAELSQHGQISEINVYNWFQNRRARSKRKQSVVLQSDNNDADKDILDSIKSKKPEIPHTYELSSAAIVSDMCLQIPEISTDIISLDATFNEEGRTIPLDLSLTSSGLDHLFSIVESPSEFMSFWQEDYDML